MRLGLLLILLFLLVQSDAVIGHKDRCRRRARQRECSSCVEERHDTPRKHRETKKYSGKRRPSHQRIHSGNMENNVNVQAALNAHNNIRRRLGLPDLEWDSGLSDLAMKHAHFQTTVAPLCSPGMEHTRDDYTGPYGQNLFVSSGTSDFTMKFVLSLWASQEEQEDYYSYGNYNHYSQVVWKDTSKVGCAALAKSDGQCNAVWVVCNYQTPGNIIGQSAY